MTDKRHSMDRSTAFTVLLELWPGFRESESYFGRPGQVDHVGLFLEAWYASPSTDMFAFGRDWVAAQNGGPR